MAYRAVAGLQMATGASRCNAGVVHRPVGGKTADRALTGWGSGMACFARKRGCNVSRGFAQHYGRDSRAHIGTGVAGGTTRRRKSNMVHRGVGQVKAISRGNGGRSGEVAYYTILRGRNMVCRFCLDPGY